MPMNVMRRNDADMNTGAGIINNFSPLLTASFL